MYLPKRRVYLKNTINATKEQFFGLRVRGCGSLPQWLSGLPDPQLEHQWGLVTWVLSDSKLSARDKALVAFGVAAVIHCPY